MEKQPSQKPNPNPSLGQKASLAPKVSIGGPKASIGGPKASLGFTPHPPMENKPSRRSAAENRMARQSTTVRGGSLKSRGDSTRGSPSQAEPQARKTRAASFKETVKNVKTGVHLLNAFAGKGFRKEKENTSVVAGSEHGTRTSSYASSRNVLKARNTLASENNRGDEEEEEEEGEEDEEENVEGEGGSDKVLMKNSFADPSTVRNNQEVVKVDTKKSKKQRKPSIPDLPYVPGPACFVFVEIGHGDKFLMNPSCRMGLIKEYIYKHVKYLTDLPVERCMKDNTFDLLKSSGAFLGLDEWESDQHCPDFEPRETYIPVVWSWQKQQQQEEAKKEIKKKKAIPKMPTKVQPADQHEVHVEVVRGPEWRYLFLECLHTDLRALYPEVHQQLQDMIEHSTSYKQEQVRKLKDMLDSDEQQQIFPGPAR